MPLGVDLALADRRNTHTQRNRAQVSQALVQPQATRALQALKLGERPRTWHGEPNRPQEARRETRPQAAEDRLLCTRQGPGKPGRLRN